jgi:ERI1 exoribonuclease 3
MLPQQCSIVSTKVATYFKSWVNIKVSFKSFYNCKKVGGMAAMLDYLKLKLIGKHHSGK